ncbi:50S ribosomal protein L33 [Fructilactobacillus lindneri]|nr:50S ribosomal protein L33 [Fructilactobacillus lindneri]SJZ69185.1 LSU ribosomal protein L33P [Fructilactobacillus lindneri DSM 20690 = JCM 11027]
MSQKKITLECSVCGARNYTMHGNSNREQRLELKKYCKHCGKNTLHKETR